MEKDTENMTLDDAIAVIKHHFTDKGGLFYRLERGENVDEGDVRMIQVSLQRIHVEWDQVQRVPKGVVMMFVDAISKLDQCERTYKNHLTEIANFSAELSKWINDIFYTERLTEEYALSLLAQHVFGTPPFIVELRRHRINIDSAAELFESLDSLSNFWLERTDIPKLGAHALFNAKDLLIHARYIFTGKDEERLENVEEKLSSLIERCLA